MAKSCLGRQGNQASNDSGALLRMKITHVVRQFAPAFGGLENFVAQLATRQAEAGHDVRVLTLDRIFADRDAVRLPQRDTYYGVEVERIAYFGSRRYPIALGALKRVAGSDVIHVHAVDFFCDFLAATRRHHGLPMVLSTHGGFFHTSFARGLKDVYFRHVTKRSLRAYSAVLACSESDEKTFRAIAANQTRLLENPVDIEKFSGLAARSAKQVIYFGRLSSNKRIDRLLAWFAQLHRSDPDWRLCLAGREMELSAADLMSWSSDLGIADQIEICVSPSDEQLRALIASSSVFCSASAYEGFGLAAIEAASAGLFPVLSDIPPHRKHVDTLGYGLIVDFEKVGQLQESISSFARAFLEFSEKETDADIQEAVSHFDWKNALKQFETAYAKAVEEQR